MNYASWPILGWKIFFRIKNTDSIYIYILAKCFGNNFHLPIHSGELWKCIYVCTQDCTLYLLTHLPEGRRPLGRPRRRWVDNIRMDLQKVGCGYMDWIGLAQDRDSWRKLVSAVINLRVPWNAGNFLTSCKPVSFSRRTLHHGVSK